MISKIIKHFASLVSSTMHIYRFDSFNVVNMDEANVFFDAAGPSILEHPEDESVCIRAAGASQRVAVTLAVALDGSKLPPLIIFKGSPNVLGNGEINSKRSKYPINAVYSVQQKACVVETVYRK